MPKRSLENDAIITGIVFLFLMFALAWPFRSSGADLMSSSYLAQFWDSCELQMTIYPSGHFDQPYCGVSGTIDQLSQQTCTNPSDDACGHFSISTQGGAAGCLSPGPCSFRLYTNRNGGWATLELDCHGLSYKFLHQRAGVSHCPMGAK